MNILDFGILLVASLIFFLGHTPLGWTVIATLLVLIIVRLLTGERFPK